jgi:hypothetical protein
MTPTISSEGWCSGAGEAAPLFWALLDQPHTHPGAGDGARHHQDTAMAGLLTSPVARLVV